MKVKNLDQIGILRVSLRSKVSLVGLLLVSLIQAWSALELNAQEVDYFKPPSSQFVHPEDDESEDGTEAAKPSGPVFKGFGKYSPQFKKLCSSLELDGRREWLFSLAEQLKTSTELCSSCEALVKTFSSACKPEKKRPVTKKKAEPEAVLEDDEEPPTPTPTPGPPKPQRQLSSQVLQQTQLLFEALAKDKDRAIGTHEAILFFKQQILEGNELKPGAKDYYSDWLYQMEFPFVELKVPSRVDPDAHEPIDEAERSRRLEAMFE